MTSAPPRSPGTSGGAKQVVLVVHRSTPGRIAVRRTTTRRSTGRRTTRPRTTGRPARRVSRRGRTGIRQWWPGLLVVVAVLVGVAWDSSGDRGIPAVPGICTIPGSQLSVTTEQAGNAAVIADVAHERGLSQRALVIALATAQQESGLRNLDHGDRDSLGLFQQRPSQGWGTAAQIQDPAYAAGKFFDHLVQVPAWQTGRLTDVAQTVQRSGFPQAYQKWEHMASVLAAAVRVGAPKLHCR
jgi:hypothetical protein